MSDEIKKKVEESFTDSILVKKKIVDQNLYQVLLQAGDIISKSIAKGGKLLICGNGGSAADAQHLTAEFLIRLTSEVNREGIPAISLLQDSSTFTAAINDFDPKDLFKRNLQTLAKSEDILLAISTSGNSDRFVTFAYNVSTSTWSFKVDDRIKLFARPKLIGIEFSFKLEPIDVSINLPLILIFW